MNFGKIFFMVFSQIVLLVQLAMSQFEYPSLFSEFPSSLQAARDPRQDRGNTGPVRFPQAPIGPETSGVRVGASGFGFVPPSGRGRAVGAVGGGPNGYEDIPYW